MNQNLNEYRKKKHQFQSYYCTGCRQRKPCHLLSKLDKEWKGYCCHCFYQNRQYWAQKHLDYELAYQKEALEKQERIHQLKLLRDYQGCSDCGSKEVEAYSLYSENKLVCQPCLLKTEGGASDSLSWIKEVKWYKKHWGIELDWWLNLDRLPVDKNCAEQWQKNPEHLNNCQCLAQQVRELHLRWIERISTIKNQLENECQCEVSPKVRVRHDNYARCERCEISISAASKKRVIKNRNDPRFWGLEVKEKVLCGDCLEKSKAKMTPLRRAKFNEYRKLGRL